MTRQRMSYNPATLGVPDLDEATFGPNALELKATIRALAAPENQEALEIISSYGGGVNVNAIPRRKLTSSSITIGEHLFSTARGDLLVKAMEKLEERIGAHQGLRPALSAMAAKELVGNGVSQSDYNLVTTPLRNFLEVTSQTNPNSPERTLVINLFLNGSTVRQALQTARRALLQ